MFAVGCGRRAEPAGPRYAPVPPVSQKRAYVVSSPPYYSSARMVPWLAPLLEHLGARMPDSRFVHEAAPDFPTFDLRMREGRADILSVNPWYAVRAMEHGYTVLLMAGPADDFRGLLLVRRDSGIRTVADLRGRTLAYASPTALGATVMPQYHLHRLGYDVRKDFTTVYVGNFDSALDHVLLGKAAAAGLSLETWRLLAMQRPELKDRFEVLATTEPLVNSAVMVRRNLPEAEQARIRTALMAFSRPGYPAFTPATDADYAPVRDFVARFEAEVRPMEEP